MVQRKAEDAALLTQGKDDNAAMCRFAISNDALPYVKLLQTDVLVKTCKKNCEKKAFLLLFLKSAKTIAFPAVKQYDK